MDKAVGASALRWALACFRFVNTRRSLWTRIAACSFRARILHHPSGIVRAGFAVVQRCAFGRGSARLPVR